MSGWSCPYQTDAYQCQRVRTVCQPGMKGCVLRGKVVFASDDPPASENKAAPKRPVRKRRHKE